MVFLQHRTQLKSLCKNNYFCNQNYGRKGTIIFENSSHGQEDPNFSHHDTTTRASKFSTPHITVSATWPSKTNRPQCIHGRGVIQKPSGQYLLKTTYTSAGETSSETDAYQGRNEAWSPCNVFFSGFLHPFTNSSTCTMKSMNIKKSCK